MGASGRKCLVSTFVFKPLSRILDNITEGAQGGGVISSPASTGCARICFEGHWHYLEHDWVAETGSYVFEPPGETHTLVVPDGVDEMITFFQVNGMMLYVDPWGQVQGYEDVFSKIDLCKKHFAAVGLGEDFVNQFIR